VGLLQLHPDEVLRLRQRGSMRDDDAEQWLRCAPKRSFLW
jgi:hypothetical protein